MGNVIINGKKYDPVTGLPHETLSSSTHQNDVKNHTHESPSLHSHARQIHTSHQQSETLNRKVVSHLKNKVSQHHSDTLDLTTPLNENIYKFAPHPAGILRPKRTMDVIASPIPHPAVERAHARSAAKENRPSTQQLTAVETKNIAIERAIKNTKIPKNPDSQYRIRPKQRVAAFMSASIAVMIFGAYITYLNMPALSVRVAASQAGINANYPEYRPTGYSFNGPVTYTDGKVTMNFKSNSSPQAFTINQSKSSWNNDAVLDNYVLPRAGTDYIPYTEKGLIIYTYDNNAAWVNGGILYTVEGDAPLSSDQIRRIATSLL